MLVFVNELLTGIGRRLFQRLMVVLVLAVALRALGFFLGAEDDSFRSTSSEMRAGPTPSAPDADDGWGTGPSNSNRSQREEYGDDGGWGSN